ncbi:DUF3999 family protein [Orbus sturtevantii]|uniref:DUF3999 family protein n=1 Tax=Orbus sturtevantii TaxID=3074109 RepID=UPI00370D18D6
MKMIRCAVACVSLVLSLNTWANQESTDNYAFGAELRLSNLESMFSRVELDKQVYTQTTSPMLDDIRVFNRNGQTVPFTLINVYDKAENKQQFDMTIYPINKDNLIAETNDSHHNYAISIHGQDINVNIDQLHNSTDKYTATYLLQVPTNSKINQSISNFNLSFVPQAENWQATADVFYSSDFRNWNNVASNVPIMTLTNNENQVLSLIDISFRPYSSYKNWLITLSSQNPIPALAHVTASSNSAITNNALYPIDVPLAQFDNQTAIYTLPNIMPIKEFSIELYHAGSVLPVSIYYKANLNDQDWTKLEDRIIRKTDNYEEPARIKLNGRLIAALKFVAINSVFDEAPKLIAYRNKVDLIFNSANNAPFILAWGAAQPKTAALPSSALLSARDSEQSLPLAFIGNPVKLAGKDVLIVDKETKSSIFADWIIWVGLIAGAGILVLLAFKLFIEVKKQDE